MKLENLIFLDTETTGLGADGRLCQIAYDFAGEVRVEIFKPPVPIEIEAMAVMHITNKMVADKEIFVDSGMYQRLKEIFQEENVLVAHNARFDAEILAKEGIKIKKMIDTHKIAHHFDSAGELPKHNLQYLRYYYDLEIEGALSHNALDDVRVVKELFVYFFERMLSIENRKEADVLKEMLEISQKPILIKKFNFGKYSGELVGEISKRDAGYLSWLLNQKIMDRENGINNDENWIFTLDHYLNKDNLLI